MQESKRGAFKAIKGLFLIVVCFIMLFITSCSNQEDALTGEAMYKIMAVEEEIIKASVSDAETIGSIALVTDTGGINDQSFNQSAAEGLKRAKKELGYEMHYLESKAEEDFAKNLEQLYQDGNDLIWGVGFSMGDAVLEAAKKHPNQMYACVDVFYEKPPENLIGVTFNEQEASFLVGYIAGRMTSSNKVGFIGGLDIPVINHFRYGYHAGVIYANKECEVITEYANSFGDVAIGKSLAMTMYNDGADIVFHASGYTGNGVIEAAKEVNEYAIGVDRDQSYLAPDSVITSALKRVDNTVFKIAKELKEGTLKGGKNYSFGLAQGGVDIPSSSNKLVPGSILADVEKIKQDILDGVIVVPDSKEAFESVLQP